MNDQKVFENAVLFKATNCCACIQTPAFTTLAMELLGWKHLFVCEYEIHEPAVKRDSFCNPQAYNEISFAVKVHSFIWIILSNLKCPLQRDCTLSRCDGVRTSATHCAILEDVHSSSKEPLMPGWQVDRVPTNIVSWSSRLGVGTSVATSSLKHLSWPPLPYG